MTLNVLLLPGDVVEIYTSDESLKHFGIDFNSGWKAFIQKRNCVFTVHKVLEDYIETSLFTGDLKHIQIESKYIKRLVSRNKTPEDEKKWLTS